MDYYTSFELMVIFFLVNNKTLHCGYKFIFPIDNKTRINTHTHTYTHACTHSPEYLKHTTDKTTNRTWTHVHHAYNFFCNIFFPASDYKPARHFHWNITNTPQLWNTSHYVGRNLREPYF